MRRSVDSSIVDAVRFMIMCPKARVAQAMRATKFTLKESENLAKQMVIRRAYKKAINEQRASFRPLQEIIAPSTPGAETTVSPLTGTTTNTATTDSTPPRAPASTPTSPRRSPRIQQKKPKQLLTRKNSRAMQKHRINKLALSDFTKRAFKWAFEIGFSR